MSSSEIEIVANALAYHPPIIIGALVLFQIIKRNRHVQKKETQPQVETVILPMEQIDS